MMTPKQEAALRLALKRAFNLGQTYWQQSDSEYTSQWKKADVTLASFNQLVEDTINEALAEQPAQQQEPVALDRLYIEALIEGLYQNEDPVSIDAAEEFQRLLGTHTSPPASKPLTDSQIEADMFWNYDDAETPHDSVEEFLNNEICNGCLEVGAVFTLLRAKRLPNIKIKVTNIDENESEAEYEIIEAAHGIKEQS